MQYDNKRENIFKMFKSDKNTKKEEGNMKLIEISSIKSSLQRIMNGEKYMPM